MRRPGKAVRPADARRAGQARPPAAANRPGDAARAAALSLIGAVLDERRPLDDAVQAALAPGRRLHDLEDRDRAFTRLLAATVLRRLGQIDAALAQCLDRPLDGRARPARNVLRLAAAQLLFLRTPPHAAVDAAVRQIARHPHLKGLVNAVLRRLAREGGGIIGGQDAARLNCPDWLWHAWTGAYGEAATRAIVEAQLAEPPLDVTVAGDATAWVGPLEARLLPTGSLRRETGGAIERLPGYEAGAWWVQDAAASLPARLLGDVRDARVLDLCAAPGGKALQLAAASAQVTAVDISSPRLRRLSDNLRRSGLSAELVTADAATWRPAEPFRLVLLDAPCSATGTIRRHPDVWHLKGPEDVERLTAVQDRLLRAAVEMLAPGGTLVYCVCSLQPEEGPKRIEKLLADGAPLSRRPIDAAEIGGLAEAVTADGDMRTLPCHLGDVGGLDGFYACRLLRRGAS